jgi:hypothetical protein
MAIPVKTVTVVETISVRSGNDHTRTETFEPGVYQVSPILLDRKDGNGPQVTENSMIRHCAKNTVVVVHEDLVKAEKTGKLTVHEP